MMISKLYPRGEAAAAAAAAGVSVVVLSRQTVVLLQKPGLERESLSVFTDENTAYRNCLEQIEI